VFTLEGVGVLVVTRLLFRGGIRLNGLPAPRADASRAPIRPFTLQDSRFTASHSTILNELARFIVKRLSGRVVSALEPGFSAHALHERCIVCVVDGVSSMPQKASEAARQLTNQQ